MKRFALHGQCGTRRGLLGALVAYALLRGLILWTAFDATAMPMYELFPMGTLAELVRRGVPLPLSYLYDNAAGQLLIGLLTVPYFAVFGPSYLALKLVPFTLGALTLVLLWSLLRKSFSPRAGDLGAWLFALGPPTIVKYSLMNSGNHFENLFFTTLALVCFYRFHREPQRMRWLFLSGVTAGFALFVFLGALIAVGLCAGVHVGVRGLRRTASDLRFALPGFALGLAPLVWINLASGARGVGFLQSKFAGDAPAAAASSGVAQRTVHFLFEDLPASTVYESLGAIGAGFFALLFLSAFLAAYAASLPTAFRGLVALARGMFDSSSDSRERFERAKLVPFVLYLPLAALAFGVSNFRIGGHAPPIVVAGYRYFLPHLLFAIALVAIVAARWIESGGPRRIAGVLLAAAPLCAGASNLAIVDWSFAHTDLGRRYQGYNLGGVGRALIASRNALSREQILAHLATFPPLLRHRVAGSIGFNVGTLQIESARAAHESSPIDVRAMIEGYPKELHVDLARGLGAALRFSAVTGSGGAQELARGLSAAHDADPRLAQSVAEGTCMAGVEPPLISLVAPIFAGNSALLASSDPTFRDASARGCGLFCGRLLARGIESDRRAVTTWLENANAHIYFGMGYGAADGAEPPRLPRDWRALVPEVWRTEFCRGFGAGLRHVYESNVGAELGSLGDELSDVEARSLAEGLAVGE